MPLDVTLWDKIWALLHTPHGAARFCKLIMGESDMASDYNRRYYQRDKANAKAAGVGVFEWRKRSRVVANG